MRNQDMKHLREYISEQLKDDMLNSLYSPSSRIFEHDYVTGVLGISVPLNESTPYSDRFRRMIIQEQLILEGFFGDFKKLAGDLKNVALAFRYIFSDPGRIKDYVAVLGKTIKESYDKASEFISSIIEKVKTITAWESEGSGSEDEKGILAQLTDPIINIFEKIKEKLAAAIDKIKGMAGWKQAMLASVVLVGVAFLWSKLKDQGAVNDGLGKVTGMIGKASKVAKESVNIVSPSLVSAFYHTGNDEQLNEFFGSIFGKKKDKKGGEEKSEEGGEEKSEEGGEEKPEDDKGLFAKVKEKVKEVAQIAIDKAKEFAAGFLKGMAADAIMGALSGGVSTAIKWMGKIFGGLKFVFEYLGPPLKKFVSMMKGDGDIDVEEEAKEAMAGEDDPTESLGRDAPLLRAYVRQSLISSRAV